jgi:predicted DsbA family dithiol-disulfide isomerase
MTTYDSKCDFCFGGNLQFDELQEAYLLRRCQVAIKQHQRQLQESAMSPASFSKTKLKFTSKIIQRDEYNAKVRIHVALYALDIHAFLA